MTTLVIGDVHGCADELRALVDDVRPDSVVLVGDLFTKGPDPVGVYRQVRALNARAVLGNHDDRLLQCCDGARPKDTHGHDIVAALSAEDPEWIAWVRSLPLFLEVGPWTVVHAGLHPSGHLHNTDRRMALVMRRFPVEDPRMPLWHQVYEGSRRVIFGHDAHGGFVRVERNGQPVCIGLDTGCVYGGRLSAYIIETDTVVSVPAQRVYRPVSRPTAAAVMSSSEGNK